MKRFRPRPGGRSRLSGKVWGAVFIVWGALLVAYLIWLGWPHPSATSATINHVMTRKQIPLTVAYSGMWQGKPVYVFHNNGADLPNINVYNWAEDSLPVLYVGAPNTFPGSKGKAPQSYLSAPYDLPSGESLWVVSSSKPPAEFKVTWDAPEGVFFTTLSAPSTNAEVPPVQSTVASTVASKGSSMAASTVETAVRSIYREVSLFYLATHLA